MDFLKKFSNKRKLKYGAVLAGFLALVIAIILVLNVLVSILADRYNWYFDMTDEGLYSASDVFIDTMERIGDVDIEIVFLSDRDKIENDFSSVGGLVGLSYVNTSATQLADELPNVTVSYWSTDNIAFMNQFTLSTQGGIKPTETNVIVMRTKAPGVLDGDQFEMYSPQDFYLSDSNSSLFAYNGEAKLIEAVIRLTQNETPTVYYLTNHGCDKAEALGELFKNAGLAYEGINLDEKIYTCECDKIYTQSELIDWNEKNNPNYADGEDIDEETGKLVFTRNFKCSNEKCSLGRYNILQEAVVYREEIPENAPAIIIYEPNTEDFSENEIVLLGEYLKVKGTVMTFLDSSVNKEDMPHFYEFLELHGNITINTAGDDYVTDINSLNASNTSFKVSIPKNDATSAFFPGLVENDDYTFVATNTVSITVNELTEESGTQNILYAMPLLQTSKSSHFSAEPDEEDDGYTIMSIAKKDTLVENPDSSTIAQQDFSSCLLVCANSSFVSDSHIVSTRNSNAKFIRSLVAATTSEQIYQTDVEFKVFNNYDLTITSNQAITVLVLSMTVLPVAAIITGFVVIYRRKRR